MHDETLQIDRKQLADDIRQLSKLLRTSESEATTALGYVIKILGKLVTPKEGYEFIQELLKTKSPEQLDNDERLLCITIGVLKRKTPFIATASKVGRNDTCPCGSGLKYKNCCLELAKAHDYNRFYGGKAE